MSPDTYKISDFHHGQEFTCWIRGIFCQGKISIDQRGRIFLCQNVEEGTSTENKFGYRYSYVITSLRSRQGFNYDYATRVENLILVPKFTNMPLHQILSS
jgi:hypothetical protein